MSVDELTDKTHHPCLLVADCTKCVHPLQQAVIPFIMKA